MEYGLETDIKYIPLVNNGGLWSGEEGGGYTETTCTDRNRLGVNTASD